MAESPKLVLRAFGRSLFCFRSTATTLALASTLILAGNVAANDDHVRFLDRLNPGVSGLQACASSASGSTEAGAAFSTVARCTADRAFAGALDEALHLVEDQGQTVFGERFRINNRLGLWAGSRGLRGELDAVVPLMGFSSGSHDESARRALFMQSGLTRWTDDQGFRRSDVRHGLVHRFAGSDSLEAGIFGLWVFVQQNLERGHERFVTGMDYTGRWGTGSLNYFAPTTDWLPGRRGYEERALEGMELDLRFDATSTITLNAATGRWEAANGSADWRTRSRLGLEWRPHPLLRIGSNWADPGFGDDTLNVRAEVSIPLGGTTRERPRWQGLGYAGGGTAVSSEDVWRAVDTVGRIEVGERSVETISGLSVSGVTTRFLQDSVGTGDTVRVEISLSSPASTDTAFNVRLVPGSGENPAVPGEDYVDETVEVTIFSGETSAEVSFQLIHNPSLQTARSLSVAVDPVS